MYRYYNCGCKDVEQKNNVVNIFKITNFTRKLTHNVLQYSYRKINVRLSSKMFTFRNIYWPKLQRDTFMHNTNYKLFNRVNNGLRAIFHENNWCIISIPHLPDLLCAIDIFSVSSVLAHTLVRNLRLVKFYNN